MTLSGTLTVLCPAGQDAAQSERAHRRNSWPLKRVATNMQLAGRVRMSLSGVSWCPWKESL